jgi:hypothetical protein
VLYGFADTHAYQFVETVFLFEIALPFEIAEVPFYSGILY